MAIFESFAVAAEPKLAFCMSARAHKVQCCGPLPTFLGAPAPPLLVYDHGISIVVKVIVELLHIQLVIKTNNTRDSNNCELQKVSK